MSWIDKILPPQIQQSDPANRKTVPEGLWVKCGGCEAVLYSTDIEANLSVCPKCGHHMRINARKRLDHLLDPKPRTEIGDTVFPVDALKFRDSKKYPDRLKQANDVSGESEAFKSVKINPSPVPSLNHLTSITSMFQYFPFLIRHSFWESLTILPTIGISLTKPPLFECV